MFVHQCRIVQEKLMMYQRVDCFVFLKIPKLIPKATLILRVIKVC